MNIFFNEIYLLRSIPTIVFVTFLGISFPFFVFVCVFHIILNMGYKDTKETIYMEIKYGKRKRAYHIGKLSFVTNKHTWRYRNSGF